MWKGNRALTGPLGLESRFPALWRPRTFFRLSILFLVFSVQYNREAEDLAGSRVHAHIDTRGCPRTKRISPSL